MRLSRVIDVSFALGAFLLIIIGFAGYTSFQSLLKRAALVDHSNQVIFTSEQIISLMKDAETGQRGYIITGDSAYLEPYFSGIHAVKEEVAKLEKLTANQPAQQVRLQRLIKNIDAKINLLTYTVSFKTKSKDTPLQAILAFPKAGKVIMDDIRKDITAIERNEENILALRSRELDKTIANTKNIILLTLFLAIAFAIAALYYIKKQILKKAVHEKELYNLNLQIDAVNKELASTNEELTTSNEELLSSNEELYTLNEELQATNEQINHKNLLLNHFSTEISDLYNNAPCGYHSTNEAGIFLNINDTELQWLGYSREEVIGKMHLMDIISKKGAVSIKATHTQFIENGYLENLESEMQRKDGSVFPILANVTYVKDAEGRFIRTHATVFDITELKKVQEKLVESEYNYKLMAENITDIISRHHPDSTYFYVSPSVNRLLGYPPDELLDKYAYDFIHPDDLKNIQRNFEHLPEIPDVITSEYRVRRKDGRYIWIETVSKLFKDPQNREVKEILSVSRNVSLRKAYEEQLKSTNQELEKIKRELEYRVRERTEKLSHTLNELQTRNHELDNYVYKVSHDLRAPLASILGLVNLTKLDSDISAIKHYLNLIENRVNKSDEFIKSVLSHSRMLNSAVKPGPINFEKIITDSVEELKYLPNQEKMKYIVNIKGKTARFCSDELRINIIIKNFISNAIKYRNPSIDENFMKFDIELTEKEAQILIEDNGLGIEKNYVNKIFDMFFRGTQLSDGSGLGLYIVKQTLDKINGTISVKSKVNQGTLFCIMLPSLVHGHGLSEIQSIENKAIDH